MPSSFRAIFENFRSRSSARSLGRSYWDTTCKGVPIGGWVMVRFTVVPEFFFAHFALLRKGLAAQLWRGRRWCQGVCRCCRTPSTGTHAVERQHISWSHHDLLDLEICERSERSKEKRHDLLLRVSGAKRAARPLWYSSLRRGMLSKGIKNVPQ